MFNWFFKFLYLITKGILELVDGILKCANMLCGIEEITVEGKKTDLLQLLLGSSEIGFAFRVAVILGLFVVVFFGVFAILRNIAKGKGDETPAQVGIKVAKTVLMFLFVPVCMFAFSWVLNVFMRALYQATSSDSFSLGQKLVETFAGNEHASQALAGVDYTNTSAVAEAIDLQDDFNFIYSWIVGIALLFCLGISMFIFVDRAISIVILFIAAPFSIASTVLDDGARFKLWRDQVLVKFITGFGVIISINVYCIIVSIIQRDSVVFFDSWFFNNLFKTTIILGGAYGMQKFTSVVGNLISAGAGSAETRENMAAAMGAAGMLKSAATSPFRAARGITNFAKDTKNVGWGYSIGSRLGFRTATDYNRFKMEKKMADGNTGDVGGSGGQNSNKANYNGDKVAQIGNAIAGDNNNNNNNSSNNNNGSGNQNNNRPNGPGAQMINNAITGDDEDMK